MRLRYGLLALTLVACTSHAATKSATSTSITSTPTPAADTSVSSTTTTQRVSLFGPVYSRSDALARADEALDTLAMPPGGPAETIPSTVTSATLTYDRTPTVPPGSTIHRTRTLDATEVQQLARTLNQLVPYPGFPDCPAVPEEQQQSTLKLAYGGHQVEMDISFGCGGVNVLVDGKQQPFLDTDYSDAIPDQTLQLLHVKPLVY